MNRYMVEVTLSGVDQSQFETLAAQEQEVVAEFVKTGFIEQIYVRNDLSGAYLVVKEHNEAQIKEKFGKFPMFAYMTLSFIQLQNLN
jgi:muconolactone delta-isomerase